MAQPTENKPAHADPAATNPPPAPEQTELPISEDALDLQENLANRSQLRRTNFLFFGTYFLILAGFVVGAVSLWLYMHRY